MAEADEGTFAVAHQYRLMLMGSTRSPFSVQVGTGDVGSYISAAPLETGS